MLSLVKEDGRSRLDRCSVGKSMGIFQVIHTLLLLVLRTCVEILILHTCTYICVVCVFLDNRYSMTFLFAACGVAVLTRWMRIDAV